MTLEEAGSLTRAGENTMAFASSVPLGGASSAVRRSLGPSHASRCLVASAAGPSQVPENLSRRSVLVAGAAAVGSVLAMPQPSSAEVFFDIDRYGDKELKVAAINSVKQNCRNILQQRPELLPAFFMLTVHDALSYNVSTNEGGPNGSLRFELDREENAFLKPAVEALSDARKISRRDISFADSFAFAGAVAMELTRGPRIVLQLGRDDAKEAGPTDTGTALYKPGASAADLVKAFSIAGLEAARDVVLIHGAEGALSSIAKARVDEAAAKAIDEDDDDDFVDGELDDVTYGKVSTKKRGAVLVSSNVATLTLGGAKFSNEYLKFMRDAKKKGKESELSQRDRSILASSELAPFVEQYAANNGRFLNDVADLFQRMSLLGSTFESLRIEDKV